MNETGYFHYILLLILLGFSLGTSGRSQIIINSNISRNYKTEPGRQEWITVIEYVFADGSYIEPLIIYKGENLFSDWISKDQFRKLAFF
jgi:hypothetical protein